MVAWIKWTEDGGIWLKRAPGSIRGFEGALVRGPVTLHPGDFDFPYWDDYLRNKCGMLPPGEGGEVEAEEPESNG